MLTERLADAFVCAHAFHRDQPRKGSDRPYIGHLMAVASLVLDADGDENAAIAGLLHDALEDQGGSRAANEIERRFGHEVLGSCASVPTGLVTARNPPGDPASRRS